MSTRQEKIYQSTAQVLLSDQDYVSALTGVTPQDFYEPPEWKTQTQADIASSPAVAAKAARRLGIPSRPAGLIAAETTAYAKPNANVIIITVADRSPALAVRIANAYADAYRDYRRELETTAVEGARKLVVSRMDDLEQAGRTDTALYVSLENKEQQLATIKSLLGPNAFLLQPAEWAYQVQPKPVRNGILGLMLGLILGIGFAALREALDTRVRSAEEIGERLALPLLARVPEPPRRLRRDNKLVMLAQPNGVEAEAFRMLRTNLDFVRLGHDVRTVMVTSAVEAEGKSTTAANLAIALARTGQRVVLVDLDLRRPFLHRFFGLDGPGLTQVALGYASLPEALVQIPLLAHPGENAAATNGNGNGGARLEGMLEVLPSGPIPPNVDDFIGTQAVADILRLLRARSDVVIVDSTPLLVVGDAMALTAAVDGVVIVARNHVVRRPMLRELRRVLDASPAQKLGFVVTGVGDEAGYEGYSYYYRGYTTPQREPVS